MPNWTAIDSTNAHTSPVPPFTDAFASNPLSISQFPSVTGEPFITEVNAVF